ncbi:hypothetical protein [Carboxylicivirga marina]|uniref:hypothetical protein n=1 Tax=Carboxylicivirga marina TaxID=2800988 RepID=UPI002593AC46|nr:hypothetical protein [uncultured Carboxylicivirga sp.]
MDTFARPWTIQKDEKEDIVKNFNIDYDTIKHIHSWTDKMDIENEIGFPDLFYSIDSARQYRDSFFSHLKECMIIGIYLPQTEMDNLIKEFEPQGEKMGEIGLRYRLRKKEIENDNGKLIGYDMIGIESGGGFHTFHCHDLYNDLKRDLEIEINENGLINSDSKWNELVDYMNDDDKGFEPVPWYFAKVKLIED